MRGVLWEERKKEEKQRIQFKRFHSKTLKASENGSVLLK